MLYPVVSAPSLYPVHNPLLLVFYHTKRDTYLGQLLETQLQTLDWRHSLLVPDLCHGPSLGCFLLLSAFLLLLILDFMMIVVGWAERQVCCGGLMWLIRTPRSHTLLQKLQKISNFCNNFCNLSCKMTSMYHRNGQHITTFSVIHDHGIFHATNSSVAFATMVAKPA